MEFIWLIKRREGERLCLFVTCFIFMAHIWRKRVFSQTLAAEILNCDFPGHFLIAPAFFMLFGQLPYIACWSGQCFYLQIWVLLGCCVDVFAAPSIVRCLFWWICWPRVLICVLEHMLDHILIYFVMCWTLLENGIAANVFKIDITLSIVCWRRLLSPILGAILWFNFSCEFYSSSLWYISH